MIRCKQVARALADERYWNLPVHKRIGLRMHVFFCIFCGRYHTQVIDMQVGVKKFLENEDKTTCGENCCLSKEARDKIEHVIHDEYPPDRPA